MTMAEARVAPTLRRLLIATVAGAVLIAAVSGLVQLLAPVVPDFVGLSAVYLLAVLPVALRWGAGPGFAVAVASVVVFIFLFVPPRLSFAVDDARYGVTLSAFLLTAAVIAHLTARSQRDWNESSRLSREQAGLRRVATLVAHAAPPQEVFAAVSDEVARLLEPDLTALVRFESDGSATFLAGSGWRDSGMRGGRPLPVPPSLVPLRDGAVVRIDDLRHRPDMAGAVRVEAMLGVVACPIVVEGRVWGAFGVGSRSGAFPAATEQRLVDFTELIDTAIANAESRSEVSRLLDEQAALRRVATLVARGVPAEEIFAQVTDEIGRVLGADASVMLRLDADGGTTVMAATGHRQDEVAVGSRWELDPQLAMAQVLCTGRSARRHGYEGVPGEFAEVIRRMQIRSSVAIPIVVEGRIWGTLGVGITRGRFPADTERRMAGFTDLVGTTIANAESRAKVTQLLDEQAALHRVATLVAREARLDEVVPAVADEIRLALGADATLMSRVDPDGRCTVLAQHGPHPEQLRVGARWTPDPSLSMAEALRTGRPAVREGYAGVPLGDAADDLIRTMRVRQAISLPVVVDGRVWGALGIARTRGERFPPDIAQRATAFAELLSTAVRNTENRAQTNRLLEEQAALRRVATVVAQRAAPQDVFAAAADEVVGLLGVDVTFLVRVDTAAIVATSGWDGAPLGAVASRHPRLREVLERGEALRLDDITRVPQAVEVLQGSGIRALVGCPVMVEGRLWGVLGAGSRSGPLPDCTEERLAAFTELVATAIANTESRAEIVRLLAEQEALRRVAMVVAHGASADEVFAAAAGEVAGTLGVDVAMLYRLDENPATATLMGLSGWEGGPLGQTFPTNTDGVAVVRRGRSIRVDDVAEMPEAAFSLQGSGIRAFVVSPVVVEGRTWGVLLVGSRTDPLPAGTERRLANFAELVGTAIGNTESRAEITRLLEHRGALRRVATLVAREAPPDEVIPAVADEIGRVFGAEDMHLLHLEPDGEAVVVARKGDHAADAGVGSRYELDAGSAMTEALRTGRPARRDRHDQPGEPAGRGVRLRSGVAIPIVVDGRIWGTLGIATSAGPFPSDTEGRLASFTELIALAVGNAENRAQILGLLAEQRALRRVATLVATGPSPTELSRAVAEEVRGLLGVDDAGVCRYEADGTAVLIVGLGDNLGRWPPGTRWDLDDVASSSEVWRTGSSARFDSDRWEHRTGWVASELRRLGVHSVAASPVIVDGRLWGAVMAWSREATLPTDTEQRMARFTELVAMAIGNAESRAELAASRARIVAASDETRRRIERDLHDGAQQRLVSLGLELRLAQANVPPDLPEVRDGIGRVADELGNVLDELREMARGIHPAMLSEGGLRPALRTLARRAPVPVELDLATHARFPQPVEVAVYYVVSEALTNAAKHAGASFVTVALAEVDGVLYLSVRDDGVGGAEPYGGSGLIGLRDRVEALGGTVAVESPRGGGTTVLVTLLIG